MSYFGPSSAAAEPVTTSADSPDSLPLKGYTKDQLANYVFRQLGAPTWEVELTKQQVLDGINDALSLFSQWVPLERVGNAVLVRGQFKYLQGYDIDQGIVRVDFVEPNPVPTPSYVHPPPRRSSTETLSTQLHFSVWAWMSTIHSCAGVKHGSESPRSGLTGTMMKPYTAFTSPTQLSATRRRCSFIPAIRTQRVYHQLVPNGSKRTHWKSPGSSWARFGQNSQGPFPVRYRTFNSTSKNATGQPTALKSWRSN